MGEEGIGNAPKNLGIDIMSFTGGEDAPLKRTY